MTTSKIGKDSQAGQILDHLQSGYTLTAKEAYEMFSTMNLAQRVAQIERAGHTVNRKSITVSSRITITEYYMDFE